MAFDSSTLQSDIAAFAGKLWDAFLWILQHIPNLFSNYRTAAEAISIGIGHPELQESVTLLLFGGSCIGIYLFVKRFADPTRNALMFFGGIFVILVLVAVVFLR
jgi:hypothetical protein